MRRTVFSPEAKRQTQPWQQSSHLAPADQGMVGLKATRFPGSQFQIQQRRNDLARHRIQVRHETPLVLPRQPQLIAQPEIQGQSGAHLPGILHIQVVAVLVESPPGGLPSQLALGQIPQEIVGEAIARVAVKEGKAGSTLGDVQIVVSAKVNARLQGVGRLSTGKGRSWPASCPDWRDPDRSSRRFPCSPVCR